MIFFLKKQLIKFLFTYFPLSFCKTFKNFLEQIQSYEDVPFSGPKCPICPGQIFFGKNDYYFRLSVGPFQCEKFLKILIVDPELGKCAILGPKMVHLVLKWS